MNEHMISTDNIPLTIGFPQTRIVTRFGHYSLCPHGLAR